MKNKKKSISVSLSRELIEWVDKFVEASVAFQNRSHFVEVALAKYRHLTCDNKIPKQKEMGVK